MSDDSTGIKVIDYSDEMSDSYVAYAEEVIKNRSLPDINDGLKPVHRRIMWDMWDTGCRSSGRYNKSAKIVGSTMGRFHPHGDSSIYDALVKMAQPFSMKYPLVDGQGNFGNIDGDESASMRYTESKMTKFAEKVFFADIGDDSVDFVSNYDGQEIEPVVLPARMPMLLLTAASGIAVGMATSILPHNLNEVGNALIAYVNNPNISLEELTKIIPAPDFPLGGLIDGSDASDIYKTGHGPVKYRSLASFETENKKKSIVIRSVPYACNKEDLLIEIAKKVNEGKIEGISDLSDYSSSEGINITIELKKDVSQEEKLNELYRVTRLGVNSPSNMNAICNRKPLSVGLLDMFKEFVDFRKNIIKRRTEYKKKKAENRLDIIDAIRIAIKNSDVVIKVVKRANDPIKKLKKEFKLNEVQAEYVYNMAVRRFSIDEDRKVASEQKDLSASLKGYKEILSKKGKINEVIISETEDIMSEFGDQRKTLIVSSFENMEIEDTVKEQEVVISIMSDGIVKAVPADDFMTQKSRFKGSVATKNPSGVYSLINHKANTHGDVMVITDKGNRYRLTVGDIPAVNNGMRPKNIKNYIPSFKSDEVVIAITKSHLNDDESLILLGEKGLLKKQNRDTINKGRDTNTIIYDIERGGKVISALVAKDNDDVIVSTVNGIVLRKSLEPIRGVGSRNSAGVSFINLSDTDSILSLSIVSSDGYCVVLADNGIGKKTLMKEFSVQNTGKKGIIGCKLVDSKLVMCECLVNDALIMVLDSENKVCHLGIDDFVDGGRAIQGNKLTSLSDNIKVVKVE